MSSLGAVGLPESDSFMQGDGADGSGSGSEPIDDTHGDDDMRGSGSGDHPIISGGGKNLFIYITYVAISFYGRSLSCFFMLQAHN